MSLRAIRSGYLLIDAVTESSGYILSRDEVSQVLDTYSEGPPLRSPTPQASCLTPSVRPPQGEITEEMEKKRRTVGDLLWILHNSNDWADRDIACWQLGELGELDELATAWVVNSLVNVTLDDEELQVRISAASALGKFGPKAASAIHALISKLRADPDTECKIAQILPKIGPGSWEVISELGKWIKYYSSSRECFLDVLASMGEPAVPTLLQALENSLVYMRLPVIRALGKMGSKAIPAVPKLAKMAEGDPNQWCREAAQEVLTKLGEEIK